MILFANIESIFGFLYVKSLQATSVQNRVRWWIIGSEQVDVVFWHRNEVIIIAPYVLELQQSVYKKIF